MLIAWATLKFVLEVAVLPISTHTHPAGSRGLLVIPVLVLLLVVVPVVPLLVVLPVALVSRPLSGKRCSFALEGLHQPGVVVVVPRVLQVFLHVHRGPVQAVGVDGTGCVPRPHRGG